MSEQVGSSCSRVLIGSADKRKISSTLVRASPSNSLSEWGSTPELSAFLLVIYDDVYQFVRVLETCSN